MTKEEADNQLRQAIIDHAEAYESSESGDMLNQYAVIAHWQPIEADGTSGYTTHYHTSNVPNHIAIGLFRTGERLSMEEGSNA